MEVKLNSLARRQQIDTNSSPLQEMFFICLAYAPLLSLPTASKTKFAMLFL